MACLESSSYFKKDYWDYVNSGLSIMKSMDEQISPIYNCTCWTYTGLTCPEKGKSNSVVEGVEIIQNPSTHIQGGNVSKWEDAIHQRKLKN